MTNLSDLISALEAATVGNRELDAEIEAVIKGWFASHLCHDSTRKGYEKGTVHRFDDGSHLLVSDSYHAPRYTTSFDAALTLAPAGCAIERMSWWPRVALGWPTASVDLLPTDALGWGISANKTRSEGRTPALALCIATLKALEAQP